ncbi:T-complex protein 1 subunit theta-like protein, partial [Tanacetum coccineum]
MIAIAIAKYAESFEPKPKTLAQNAYLHVEGIIKALYADHAAGNVKVSGAPVDAVCDALSIFQ